MKTESEAMPLETEAALETEELCRDIQMTLPDAFWALDYVERYRFGRFSTGLSRAAGAHACRAGGREVPYL